METLGTSITRRLVKTEIVTLSNGLAKWEQYRFLYGFYYAFRLLFELGRTGTFGRTPNLIESKKYSTSSFKLRTSLKQTSTRLFAE